MKRLVILLGTCLSLMMSLSAFAGNKISPQTIAGATTVNTTEAKALFDKGVIFIDVRSNKDWAAGRIPDAVHIELKKVLSETTLSKEVGKNDEMVIYCNGEKCMRSSKATAKAVGWGFNKIHYYRDGFPAWKKAGYPVE